jgi:glutaredoxin-related protein
MAEAKPKAMISQPMRGFSDEHIDKVKKEATEVLENLGYEVVNTLFSDEFSASIAEFPKTSGIPLLYLAKSITVMAGCDAVYFCSGYEVARGCLIEHMAAKSYGLKALYQSARMVQQD